MLAVDVCVCTLGRLPLSCSEVNGRTVDGNMGGQERRTGQNRPDLDLPSLEDASGPGSGATYRGRLLEVE